MTQTNRLLHLVVLTVLPICLADAGTIATTDFDGRTLTTVNIANDTASSLNWTLSGLDDPGDMTVLREGTINQALFDGSAVTQNAFAPALNVGNGNTWWRTSVDLVVSAGSAVTLTDVTFGYWAISGSQAQNVNRKSDFAITLYDPFDAVVGTASIDDVVNGTGVSNGAPTPVLLPFATPVALTEPGTYRLEIDGGDFSGADETGNHTGIDNLSINGTTGVDNTPPAPNPMRFLDPPTALGQFSITMTAETATDENGVEYRFHNTTLATNSGWQDSAEWTDTGLAAGTEYFYTVAARDKSPGQNETAPSTPAVSATTDATDLFAPLPDPMTFAVMPTRVAESAITMTATTAIDESGVEYLFENLTLATDSDWQASSTWTDTALDPSTTYSYRVTARDTSPDQWETAPSSPVAATTDFLPDGDEIFGTSFIGRVLAGTTATLTDSVVNGVLDPGSLTVVDAGGFYDSPNAAGFFAPQDNPPIWSVDIPLEVGGSALGIGEVVVDFQSFNNGGNTKVGPVPAHTATVTLLDPSDSPLGSESITGPGSSIWTGTFLASLSGTTLTAGQTYTVRIELTGNGGNNVALDAVRIRPGSGGTGLLLITNIALAGGNVVLTTNVAAAGLTPQISQDLTSGSFRDVDGGKFSVTGANEITIDSSALTPPTDYFRIRN